MALSLNHVHLPHVLRGHPSRVLVVAVCLAAWLLGPTQLEARGGIKAKIAGAVVATYLATPYFHQVENHGKYPLSPAHERVLAAAASACHVPLRTVIGVRNAESGGQTDAVSQTGARGAMQLTSPAAVDALAYLKAQHPTDPTLARIARTSPSQALQGDHEANLALGACYLGWLKEKVYGGSTGCAIRAYFAGSKNVPRLSGIGCFPVGAGYAYRRGVQARTPLPFPVAAAVDFVSWVRKALR